MRTPNWHHFDRVLRSLGYKMVQQQFQGYLYFEHPTMKQVVLEKHNKYTDAQVDKYLATMMLPRPYLEPIYKNCRR